MSPSPRRERMPLDPTPDERRHLVESARRRVESGIGVAQGFRAYRGWPRAPAAAAARKAIVAAGRFS